MLRALLIGRLWVIGLWLMAQLAMPFAHAATLDGATAERIVICTAQGFQLVALDDAGEAEHPAPTIPMPDCTACHVVCAGALTPGQTVIDRQPTSHAVAGMPVVDAPRDDALATRAFHSRAPPA